MNKDMSSDIQELCKVRCRHGHALTPDNTYTHAKSGRVYCKKCRAMYVAAYKYRHPEKAKEWNRRSRE